MTMRLDAGSRRMEDDGGPFDLDADDRALALHEAGHAVMLHVVDVKVTFVQVKWRTADGLTGAGEVTGDTKKLAVLLAGVCAELIFAKPRRRETLEGDFRQIRDLLMSLPDGVRRHALAEARRFAEMRLRANADTMHQIADALLDRRKCIGKDHLVRIEGEELAALLAGATGAYNPRNAGTAALTDCWRPPPVSPI
jgi:hypothetical protein